MTSALNRTIAVAGTVYVQKEVNVTEFQTQVSADFATFAAWGMDFNVTVNDITKLDPAIAQLTEDGRISRPGRIDRVVYDPQRAG